MITLKKLSRFTQFAWSLVRWVGFKVPHGERIPCWKDRRKVGPFLSTAHLKPNWSTNETQTKKSSPGKIAADGTGSGTPMQLGRSETRRVTWGSGYGRHNQWNADVPLPLVGNRYWVTGYPVHQYDKRCIIMAPSGVVHELLQFDQDLGILPAGFPQQALNLGSWKNGVLISGKAVTASGLPGSAYIWGIGSIEEPHCQAFTVEDYYGGDGSDEFAESVEDVNTLPHCGDWYYLPPTSKSYLEMVALGGQCEARAKAAAEFGLRLIDRGGTTSVLTQAGTWADSTNIDQFSIDLKDLILVD